MNRTTIVLLAVLLGCSAPPQRQATAITTATLCVNYSRVRCISNPTPVRRQALMTCAINEAKASLPERLSKHQITMTYDACKI